MKGTYTYRLYIGHFSTSETEAKTYSLPYFDNKTLECDLAFAEETHTFFIKPLLTGFTNLFY